MIGEQSNQRPTVMVKVYHTHLVRNGYLSYRRGHDLNCPCSQAKRLIRLIYAVGFELQRPHYADAKSSLTMRIEGVARCVLGKTTPSLSVATELCQDAA
jgi:hypothetical protein